MKLQSQVTLNDAEVKLAIATFIETNGIAGAINQADSVIIKRSASNGFTAVLDVIQDTDPTESTTTTQTTTVAPEPEVVEENDEVLVNEEVTEEEATEALDAAQVTTATSLFR